MARIGRRGKSPRDPRENAENISIPSNVLSTILNKLDLTFERDIGMLNGTTVRTLPNRETLVDLQGQLDQLHNIFDIISKSDQDCIDHIRNIRESRKKESTNEITNESTTNSNEVTENKDEEEVAVPEILNNETEIPEKDETSTIEEEKESLKEENNLKRPLHTEDEEVASELTSTQDIAASGEIDETNKEDDVKEENKEVVEEDKSDAEEEEGTSIDKQANTEEENDEPPTKKPKLDETVNVDQMENDPNVKNPKSEFVISQTLPQAARTLGLYNEEGLESTGEEYLRKKYSVASYPASDLKELLPGDLPDMDLSGAKPTNQIQYSTFLSYVDNFFKELNEDDIKILKSKYILPANLEVDKNYDPEVTPFILPKLGPLYTRTWFKEDANKNIGNSSPPPVNDISSIIPKKSATDICDEILETEDVSCGPLLSRLLSAILKENENLLPRQITTDKFNSGDTINVTGDIIKHENSDDKTSNLEFDSHEQTPLDLSVHTPMSEIEDFSKYSIGGTTSTLRMDQGWRLNSVNLDYPTLEERLKRELKYVGIYMNLPKDENNPHGGDPDWLTGREDDEISAEIRELQSSLKQVTVKNQKRKEVLIPLVQRQLAWQEYSSILEDLDKQIDQAYIKRIRVPKKRKKHHTGGSNVSNGTASQIAQQNAANSSLKALLDKRQRWINKIGPLFDSPEIMKRIPKKCIFGNMDQEEEEEEGDVFDQTHDAKDDELEA